MQHHDLAHVLRKHGDDVRRNGQLAGGTGEDGLIFAHAKARVPHPERGACANGVPARNPGAQPAERVGVCRDDRALIAGVAHEGAACAVEGDLAPVVEVYDEGDVGGRHDDAAAVGGGCDTSGADVCAGRAVLALVGGAPTARGREGRADVCGAAEVAGAQVEVAQRVLAAPERDHAVARRRHHARDGGDLLPAHGRLVEAVQRAPVAQVPHRHADGLHVARGHQVARPDAQHVGALAHRQVVQQPALHAQHAHAPVVEARADVRPVAADAQTDQCALFTVVTVQGAPANHAVRRAVQREVRDVARGCRRDVLVVP